MIKREMEAIEQDKKRVHERVVAFWAVAMIDKNNRKYIGQLQNISFGGLLIFFKENFSIGERFKFLVKAIFEGKALELEFIVKVSHVTLHPSSGDYAVGVKIVSDVKNGQSLLARYIKHKLQQKANFIRIHES